jgi:hypothetical protein
MAEKRERERERASESERERERERERDPQRKLVSQYMYCIKSLSTDFLRI